MMKEGYSGRAVAAAGALGERRQLGLVPRVGFDDDEAVVAEHGRAVDGADQVESSLASPVRGRPRVMPLGGEDPRPLVRPRDDSHVGTVPERGLSLQQHRGATRFRNRPRSGTVPKSRERVDFCTGEEAVDLVVERTLVSDQFAGELARPFEQLAVCSQPREAEFGKTRLTSSEQLALAAQLQLL